MSGRTTSLQATTTCPSCKKTFEHEVVADGVLVTALTLTAAQVAETYGGIVKEATVIRYMREGRLRGYLAFDHWVIDIEDFLEDRERIKKAKRLRSPRKAEAARENLHVLSAEAPSAAALPVVTELEAGQAPYPPATSPRTIRTRERR